MPLACAAAGAPRMQTETACATRKTAAWMLTHAITSSPTRPSAILQLCEGVAEGVGLVLETVATDVEGGQTCYNLFLQVDSPEDVLTAVIGKSDAPLAVTTTETWFQNDGSLYDSHLAFGEGEQEVAVLGNPSTWAAFEGGADLLFNDEVGGGWTVDGIQGVSGDNDGRSGWDS